MKLLCPECRRENEPERIYCHDCGARLDRSKLSKAVSKEEDPKETQRRLRNLMDGSKAKMRQRFFQSCQLLLGALTVAALVQILRAPDLPKPSETSAMMPSQINLDLEDASMDPRNARPLRYTEEQVNEYVSYVLKSKRAALSKYLTFQSAIVALEDGSSRVTVERSLFGLSLYSTISFVPRIENGNVVAKVRGGSLGRMPIHPALMEHGEILFADLKAALDRERKSISKLGAISIQPKLISLTPRSALPASSSAPPLLQPGASQPPLPQPPLPQP